MATTKIMCTEEMFTYVVTNQRFRLLQNYAECLRIQNLFETSGVVSFMDVNDE